MAGACGVQPVRGSSDQGAPVSGGGGEDDPGGHRCGGQGDGQSSENAEDGGGRSFVAVRAEGSAAGEDRHRGGAGWTRHAPTMPKHERGR